MAINLTMDLCPTDTRQTFLLDALAWGAQPEAAEAAVPLLGLWIPRFQHYSE